MLRPDGFPEWTETYFVNGSFACTSTIFMDDLIERYLAERRLPAWFPDDHPPEYWEIPGYAGDCIRGSWYEVKILENDQTMVMIHDWLAENVKGKWYSGFAGLYFFSEAEDAMLFRLSMPVKDT